MTAASNLTTAANVYKRVYSGSKPADLATRDHVWYAMMARQGGFTGKSFTYNLQHGFPQGISGSSTVARANATSSSGVAPEAYRTRKFACVTIQSEAAQAAKGNKGAFFDLITHETDSVLIEMGDRLAYDFYRGPSCVRGHGASAVGNVLTLAEPSDVRNFKPKMVIVSDNAADGLSLNTGSTFVVAINRAAGTVTFDDLTDISGFAATDYLFGIGDPGTGIEGMEYCTPLSAPVYGVDSFRGIDRGVDSEALAGSRLDDSSLNAEVALGRGAVMVADMGKSHALNQAFLNPVHFYNVTQRLNAKVEYSDGGGSANYGFEHITIHTAAGSMRVYSDPDCPLNRGRASRMGTQYIKHMGELPHIFDLDGNQTLRLNDDLGIETIVEAYSNLIQEDTMAQFVCSLATS